MNYELRPYQQQLLDQAADRLSKSNSVLIQLPTGGGKTVVLSHCLKIAISNGSKCLVLAHREELIFQAAEKIVAVTGQIPGIIKAKHKPNYALPVQVASVQSLVKRLDRCPDFDMIVIDECHHATSRTYRLILEHFPNAKVIGLSATPIRHDKTGLKDLFDHLVVGVSISELIELGALSPYKYFASEKVMCLRGVSKRGGDYKSSDVARVNPVEGLAGDLVKAYQDYLNGKQAIIFCVNIEHSITIAAHFRAVGISAAHLDSSSSSFERSQVKSMFQANQIKILTNCALYTEGVDIPGLDGVILARPTASLGMYLQMVGRPLRPWNGKENAVIIDMAGNWKRHGLPCDPREWTLDGLKENGRSQQKQLQRQSTGEVIEVEIDLRTTGAKVVEISSSISPELLFWIKEIDQILLAQTAGGHRPNWCAAQLLESPRQPPMKAWKYLGKKLGYHHGWARHKFTEWKQDFAPAEVLTEEDEVQAMKDIWQTALSRMSPDCHTLFGTFGMLVSITDNSMARAIVTIEIKSQTMKTIAERKIPELSSVFSLMLAYKCTVSLVLQAAPKSSKPYALSW